MEDRQIIKLFQLRDPDAPAAAQNKYGTLCMRLAANMLGAADAEECVNDMLLKLWDSIPPAEPACLSAYMARITHNLAISRWRQDTAAKRGGGELPAVLDELAEVVSGSPGADEEAEAAELAAAVNDFLAGLEPRKRVIFVRRVWYTDSLQSIASDLGISSGAAAADLSRTRAKLRLYLIERGFEI